MAYPLFPRPLARPGFTLVELLAVLMILAVLATVAVRSVDRLVDQAPHDATVAGLEHLRTAILGDDAARGPDGGRLVAGFVADIGRLPRAVGDPLASPDALAGSSAPTQLRELYDPSGFRPYAIRSPASGPNTDVHLGSGWRGPYVRPALGAGTGLVDGWGFAWQLEGPSGPATDGQEIRTIRSRGADGPLGVAAGPYDADLGPVVLAHTDPALDPTQATLVGQVAEVSYDPSDPPTVEVYLIRPAGWVGDPADADGDGLVEQAVPTAAASSTPSATADVTFRFGPVATVIGPQALRAVVTRSSGVTKGPPVYVNVVRGGPPPVRLTVPD